MALPFIPYGRISTGQYGLAVGNNEVPNAVAIEIVSALPDVSDTNNFTGRSLFLNTNSVLYQYSGNVPTGQWRAVDNIPVAVGSTDPTASSSNIPGSLYYQTVTKLLYVWDGAQWDIIGGQYAVSILTRTYTGDGTTTTFSTGATVSLTTDMIFVSIDGVVQVPTNDYSSLGTNIIFTSPPPTATKVLMKSFVTGAVAPNTSVLRAAYTGNGTTASYNSPDSGVSPNGTFVFVNRLIQILGIDYTITSASTAISAITNVGGTATVLTVIAHNLSIGSVVTLQGVTQSDYNNQTFTVTSIPTSTSFTFAISPSAASSGTGAAMYYTPSYKNDTIVFTTPPANTLPIEIRTLKGIIAAPTQGEANTAASVGAGTSVPYGKSGTVLQFKSLTAGANVQITDNGTSISIAVDTLNAFDAAEHINTSTITVTDTSDTKISYLGVRSTTSPVTINLSGIPISPSSDGRRITIVDESGGASGNPITITTGGPLINGQAVPFTINTAYGFVTLNFDGANYFVSNRSF